MAATVLLRNLNLYGLGRCSLANNAQERPPFWKLGQNCRCETSRQMIETFVIHFLILL